MFLPSRVCFRPIFDLYVIAHEQLLCGGKKAAKMSVLDRLVEYGTIKERIVSSRLCDMAMLV